MNYSKDILDAIEIIVDERMKHTTQIKTGIVSEIISSNYCKVKVNGIDFKVQYYGSVSVNRTYRVFIPENNMSIAFIIGVNT